MHTERRVGGFFSNGFVLGGEVTKWEWEKRGRFYLTCRGEWKPFREHWGPSQDWNHEFRISPHPKGPPFPFLLWLFQSSLLTLTSGPRTSAGRLSSGMICLSLPGQQGFPLASEPGRTEEGSHTWNSTLWLMWCQENSLWLAKAHPRTPDRMK